MYIFTVRVAYKTVSPMWFRVAAYDDTLLFLYLTTFYQFYWCVHVTYNCRT
jgi:hypothetical protein